MKRNLNNRSNSCKYIPHTIDSMVINFICSGIKIYKNTLTTNLV